MPGKDKVIVHHAKAHYKRVDPSVEYIVTDINDVVVAICAHKEDADILARVKGYGWHSDTSHHMGTTRVGEDSNRLFTQEERKMHGLKPRNDFAVR